MATFHNDDVARIRATLAPYANDDREFVVEICDYGHRLEAAVGQIVLGEQYRNGCALDMNDPGTAATYAELGHDATVEAFASLSLIALVGYSNRVKAAARFQLQPTPDPPSED